MTIELLKTFVDRVIVEGGYDELDRLYLTNRVLALVGEEGVSIPTSNTNIIDLKDELLAAGVKSGYISELIEEQDIVGAQLMDLLTPLPSEVNKTFWSTYKINPKQAIADFYQLSKANDYIKVKAISQNIAYKTSTKYGDLEITINLSKPEKDPKAIAAAKLVKNSDYPKCQLCMENEGYQGRLNHPARANHRVIRFDIEEQGWGFQYSPYAYFNEHAIFFLGEHEPMKISSLTFERLLDIVDKFPGYFAGSNADLPIVGGSILTHEHYQGGRHTFPMELATIEKMFTFTGFSDVKAGIVNWPMSVIRLISDNKESLVVLASKILDKWRVYNDPLARVMAITDDGEHHTITPIARKKNGQFELDLVLRDNQTSAEFPDGIYHPHQDVQHIKKENIGLIEVMGLAILPPRLKVELSEVERYLLGQENEIADYHKAWADAIRFSHSEISEKSVESLVREEVGQVFARVLEDAGVYKRTREGQAAFNRFIKFVGID